MNVPFKGSIARDRYRWHCDMLADRDRNAAYAQGLRRWDLVRFTVFKGSVEYR